MLLEVVANEDPDLVPCMVLPEVPINRLSSILFKLCKISLLGQFTDDVVGQYFTAGTSVILVKY